MTTSAGGFVTPDHCEQGQRVIFWNQEKGVYQTGTVLSVGEAVSVVQVDKGPQRICKWTDITAA